MKLKVILVLQVEAIQESIKIANAIDCDYIKLSAIPEVITYYHKVLDLDLLNSGDTEKPEITAHIKTELMNVVKSGRKVVYSDISRLNHIMNINLCS